jgi:hypothetical protein
MTIKKKLAVPPSESGYWTVELSRVFDHRGFAYRPGPIPPKVDQATLNDMIAEGVVTRVATA